MALQTHSNGYTVTEADWNSHVNAINQSTNVNEDQNAWITQHEQDYTALVGRVDTVESTNSDQTSRLDTLESGHHARYYAAQGATQTTTTDTFTKTKLSTPVTTSPDVTPNANNDEWTLNRAGVWSLSGSIRWTANETGQRYLLFAPSSAVQDIFTAAIFNSADTGETAASCSVERYFDAGDTVSLFTYQSSGGDLDLSPAGELNAASFTWIRG